MTSSPIGAVVAYAPSSVALAAMLEARAERAGRSVTHVHYPVGTGLALGGRGHANRAALSDAWQRATDFLSDTLA